jgi:hypothetical protein
MTGIIGKKLGMTQVYDDKGRLVPVTVIEAGPCPDLFRWMAMAIQKLIHVPNHIYHGMVLFTMCRAIAGKRRYLAFPDVIMSKYRLPFGVVQDHNIVTVPLFTQKWARAILKYKFGCGARRVHRWHHR